MPSDGRSKGWQCYGKKGSMCASKVVQIHILTWWFTSGMGHNRGGQRGSMDILMQV